MIKRLLIWFVLGVVVQLHGCTSRESPLLGTDGRATSSVEVNPISQTMPLEKALTGQLQSSDSGDRLEFRVMLPNAECGMGNAECEKNNSAFRTSHSAFHMSSLDLTQIKYLRIWVRGHGINDRMWNQEGFVDVSGNPKATLSVAEIPKGTNRIVAAQGYDANRQTIPGA